MLFWFTRTTPRPGTVTFRDFSAFSVHADVFEADPKGGSWKELLASTECAVLSTTMSHLSC